ncbi:hypothetical protein GCM10010172_34680 [Paractinoplanes ferrugineus]|uniref:Polymerase nucleotidyl transferase domain-containing protein n=1 Tax=Paractinoplanes ferrugineus TaxID=113564 RepID=A0A919JA34_9ACTN|nr:hypothetical protein [Actinoplanes ferrugineus]GIE15459.1 hypothetical protein Afe05nite_72990 [Actinoplanes ferrugineus]
MTSVDLGVEQLYGALREKELVPDSCRAVFIGGSVARGWQHSRSDTDLYLVSGEAWEGESDGFNTVAVDPASVPTNVTFVDGNRIELRYWQESQFDQVLAKVTWDAYQNADSFGQKLSQHEAALLSRLTSALVLVGDEWVTRRREEVAASAFRSMLALRCLSEADSWVRDALGMTESGDFASAVLAAQNALAASADALSLGSHEYSIEPKWRARRMEIIGSPILPFDRYWELATMRTYDPANPTAWIESVLEVCREVALEVEV